MTIKVALEHEGNRRSIAVYRNDIEIHYRLKDSDDEYRIFEIVSHTIKGLERR